MINRGWTVTGAANFSPLPPSGGRGAGGEGGRRASSAVDALSRFVGDSFSKRVHIGGFVLDVVAYDVEPCCSEFAFAGRVINFPELVPITVDFNQQPRL